LLRPLALTVALSDVATRGAVSVFYFYCHVQFGWGSAETGTFLSALGGCLLLSQGLLAPAAVAAAGGAEAPVIVVGFVFDAAYLLIFGAATRGAHMYVGLAVATAAFATAPALKGLLSRQVPRASQGRLQGGLTAMTTVAAPAAPVVTTALFGFWAPRGVPGAPMYALAGVALVGAVVASSALSHPRLVR